MSKLISIGKIITYILIALGVIHDIATFTPLIREGLVCLSKPDLDAMTYMSLICGTSLILCGILCVMLLTKVEKFIWLSSPLLVIGIFLCLNGVLSIFYMYDNPFAWMTFLSSTSMLLIILILKKKIST